MIPKSVRVLGRRFSVTVIGRDKPLPGGGVSDDTRGITDLEREAIALYGAGPLQSEMSMRDTFLHESLHAMMYLGRLSVYLKPQDQNDEESRKQSADESFVAAFAPHLLAFLRDNPQAIAYLTEGVR